MELHLLWQHAVHHQAIYGLACSHDGRLVASCGADGTMQVLRHTASVGHLTHPQRAVFHDLVSAPTPGLLLAAGCSDGKVWLWDAHEQRVRGHLRHLGGEVVCVAWSPTGHSLAWGASDGSVCLWNVEEERLRLRVSHQLPVRGVALHSTRPWLASASEDGQLCLWELTQGSRLSTLVSGTAWVSCVAFSPDGGWLAAGLEDGEVLLADLATGQVSHQRDGHTAEVQRVAFSPQSRLYATSSTDGMVCLWSVEQKKRVGVPMIQPAVVGALAFLPRSASGEVCLVTGDALGYVRCWSLDLQRFC